MDDAERNLTINFHFRNFADAKSREYHEGERRRIDETLSADKAAEKARAELAKDTNAARIRERMRSLKAEKEASDQEIKGFSAINAAVTSTSGAVAGFVASIVGFSSLKSTFSMVVQEWENIRKVQRDAAMDVLRYQGSLRELGALTGNLGKPTAQMIDDLRFRSKTLQTSDDARAMHSAALGIGEAAIDQPGKHNGVIAPDEFTKLLEAAGKFQTLEGGDAAAHGVFAGQIPLVAGKRINAAQGEALMQHLYKIQQPGGFPTFSSAANQFSQISPLIQNKLFTPEEGMGLLSAFSISKPGSAATTLEQATRAVSAGIMKERGMKLAEDYKADQTTTAGYFKKIGIEKGSSPLDRLKAIAKDLDVQGKKDPRFSSEEYLLQSGFGNMEDRQAISTFAGIHNTGIWKNKFEPVMANRPQPGGISATFDERVKSEPFFGQQQTELARQMTDIQKGMGMPTFRETLSRGAYARLGPEKMTDTYEATMNRHRLDPRELLFGNRQMLEQESQRLVLGESARLGVPMPKGYTPDTSIRMGWDQLYAQAQKNAQAGGQMTPGVDAKLFEKILDSLEKIEANTKYRPDPPKALPQRGSPTPYPSRP